MIEVLDAACSHDLTTVEALKVRLGSVTDEQEEQLIGLIKYASDYVKRLTNQTFARERVKETLPGFGLPTMALERTPIVSIESASFNGVAKTDVTIKDNRAGLIYCLSGFENTALYRQGLTQIPVPNSEQLLHEIIYTGGYILPSMDESTRNLPYDIEEACIELIRDQYERVSGNLKSIRVGDYAATFGSVGASDKVKEMLSPYIRISF